ncbi:tetratricopeptide (TPR) repeat protein [Rheinheimera pacifica]|uniref:tetratricopeptide repeat protein n=1 Tax=Rheinheimera pacifica TaxID=173990 RepID=UPI00216A6D47|nr:hypothetical protein [Rheinheimera pacifica]MCS4308744.1 tetratricopeptide (TPR) repeat protein [Rheinheimera pacifica]
MKYDSVDLVCKEIDCFRKNKQYCKIIDICTTALSSYPDDVMILSELSHAYISVRNYHSAVDVSTKEIEITKNDSYLYFKRGRCFLYLSEYLLADSDFDMIIALKDSHPRNDAYVETGYFFKAYASIKLGAYSVAAMCLQQVREDFTGHLGDGGVQTKISLLKIIERSV